MVQVPDTVIYLRQSLGGKQREREREREGRREKERKRERGRERGGKKSQPAQYAFPSTVTTDTTPDKSNMCIIYVFD